ncbi:ACT domain-containing protein [Desulfoscipio sp. XC116]|uniref:ACT domain-containing protein n=1 Tax=Desulfoscipio sp. XC116 TaxID=3144975 RepID=UPI00325ABF72
MTKGVIIVLTVNNYPGVMSRITELFSGRNYNLDGILCAPIEDGSKSRMYLLVNEDKRLSMILAQLGKLYDVKTVSICDECDRGVFDRLHSIVGFNNRQ